MHSRYGLNHMDVLADGAVARWPRMIARASPLERARPGCYSSPQWMLTTTTWLPERAHVVRRRECSAREIHHHGWEGRCRGHPCRRGRYLDVAHREHRDAPLRSGGTDDSVRTPAIGRHQSSRYPLDLSGVVEAVSRACQPAHFTARASGGRVEHQVAGWGTVDIGVSIWHSATSARGDDQHSAASGESRSALHPLEPAPTLACG
jgi:hypothetical protein